MDGPDGKHMIHPRAAVRTIRARVSPLTHPQTGMPTTTARLALAAWRTKRGLSQTDLARAVGVRQATLSDLETGKAKVIRLALLDALARALGCDVAQLFKGPPTNRRA